VSSPAHLFERAARDPNGLALDDGTRRRSWAELADRCARTARLLREDAGLAPGERVALLMESRAEAVELVIGAILAGLWIVPVNWHLTGDEVAHVLADSGARLVLADARFAALAREAGARELLLAGDELERALVAASDAPPDLGGPAGATMIYTSGTTGRPKGVRRAQPATLGEALAQQGALGRRLGLDGAGPHLVTGPLYHAAPLLFAIYDQANGAPIVVLPRWDDRAALVALAEREIAHTHVVPTMFVRLLRLPEDLRAAFRAPRLSLVLHGAAPVSPEVKRRMLDWWGPILVEYWGGTEGGVTTLVDSRDWLAHPGTVGRALPGFEVFAVDAEGRRLPPGEEGLLFARHPTLERPFEYHRDPEKTARAYLAPGVFTLGDVGRVDADGWVHLTDRQSHLIISGGVNIYPAEVERVLAEHPAVADVGVFGVPDDEWGESVRAAVELLPGAEPSPRLAGELIAFARQRLAGYKVPRAIDFEPRLPRDTTGKLYVRRLRERHLAGAGRAPASDRLAAAQASHQEEDMASREMSLREISDRIAISDLLTRYTVAIDKKDWNLLDTCFTPDAQVDYTQSGGIKGRYPEVREWLSKALAIFPITQHFISNSTVKLDGDKATSRTYVINPMVFVNPDGSQHIFTVGAYYNDELVFTRDGWRIASRFEEQAYLDGGLPEALRIPR
jgi:long-chain acyl-CoA synthetase